MSDRDIWERILRNAPELAALFPRQPRYRYFEHRGHMFCWTTEKMADGKYRVFDYVPVGKGARTKPTQWKLRNEVKCRTRQLAKRKALDRYHRFKGA